MTTTLATSASTQAQPQAHSARMQLDEVDFLRLLTTQMRHQDPLKPMDDAEFIGQLTQFSILNESRAQRDVMEKLLEGSGNMQYLTQGVLRKMWELGELSLMGHAFGMVGKSVKVWSGGQEIAATVQSVRFMEQGIKLVTDVGEVDMGDVTEVRQVGDPGEGSPDG